MDISGEGAIVIDVTGSPEKSPQAEWQRGKGESGLAEALQARNIRTGEDLTRAITSLSRALEASTRRSIQDPFTGQFQSRERLEERRAVLSEMRKPSGREGWISSEAVADAEISHISSGLRRGQASERRKEERAEDLALFTSQKRDWIPDVAAAEEGMEDIHASLKRMAAAERRRDARRDARQSTYSQVIQELAESEESAPAQKAEEGEGSASSATSSKSRKALAGGAGKAVGRGTTKPRTVSYTARRIGQGIAHTGAALGGIFPGAGALSNVLSPMLTGLGAAGVGAGVVAATAGVAGAAGAYMASPYIQGYFGRKEPARQAYIEYEKTAGESDLQHEIGAWATDKNAYLRRIKKQGGDSALPEQAWLGGHGISGLDVKSPYDFEVQERAGANPLWNRGGREIRSLLMERKKAEDREAREEKQRLLSYAAGGRHIRDPESDLGDKAPDDISEFMRRGELNKWGILSLVPATLRAYGQGKNYEGGKYAQDSKYHREATGDEIAYGSFDDRYRRSFGTPLDSDYGKKQPMGVAITDTDDYQHFLNAGNEVLSQAGIFRADPAVLLIMGTNGQVTR